MARRRQPAGLRRYWAAKRRGKKSAPKRRRRRSYRAKATTRRQRTRHNFSTAGMLMNKPQRRRRRGFSLNRRHRRRAYRSNPQIFGFTLPPLDAVLFTGVGYVVPPLVTSFVMSKLPAEWQTKPVNYLVKAASVIVPSMLVGKFISQRAGNLMLVGGAASFVLDLVRDFAPGVIPGLGAQPFLGKYMPMRPARSLGAYTRRGGSLSAGNGGGSPMLANVPERLLPTGRF